MGKLTDYLSTWKLTDQPRHPSLSSIRKPSNLTCYSKTRCRGCAQETAHPTYERGKLTSALDPKYVPRIQRLKHLQYLISWLNRCWSGMHGQNIRWNGSGCLNYADSQTLVVVAASGREISAKLVDGSDPRDVSWHQSRYVPEETIYWTYHVDRGCVVQPGDLANSVGSCLDTTCQLTVVKVLGVTYEAPNWYVAFEVNQDVTNLMWPGSEADPDAQVYLQVWRQGDPEAWQQMYDMAHHLVSRRSITLTSATVPEDGRVELLDSACESCSIAVPQTTAPRTLIATAVRADTGEQQDWSVAVAARIQIESVGDGTYRTWLCLKDKDYEGNTVSGWTDMTAVFGSLRVQYYPTATAAQIAAGRYRIAPTGGRCRYALRDWSDSWYNYQDGEAVDDSGHTYHCARRRWATVTLVPDDPPTGRLLEQTDWYAASGVAKFVPSCLQYGVCDQFEELHASDDRPWGMVRDWSGFFRACWCAVPTKWRQMLTTIPIFVVDRIAHPSIRSLLGHCYSLSTAAGMHEQHIAKEFGEAGICSVSQVADGLGNTTIEPVLTHFSWSDNDPSEIVVGNVSTYPSAGYGASVAGTTHHKLLDYANNEDATSDPSRALRYHEARQGLTIEMDSMEQKGRAQNRWGHVEYADSPVFAERIDPTNTTSDQERGDVTVRFWSSPVAINGVEYGGICTFARIITTGKVPQEAVVSGTVHSITRVGSTNEWDIEIDLSTQKVGFPYGDPGERYDKVTTFNAGGNFVKADDWQIVVNFYARDKEFGSKAAKCYVGDSVSFSCTDEISGITDFDEKCFLVSAANAHAGTAGDQGTTHEILTFVSTGYYQPPEDWLRVDIDDDDAITTADQLDDDGNYLHGYPIDVVITEGATTYTQTEADVRPDTLATQTYWVEVSTGRIYWSEADKGHTVAMSYKVEGGISTTRTVASYVIAENTIAGYTSNFAAFKTLETYSTYSAYSKVVTIGTDVLTATTNTNPTRDQYRMVDDSGSLVFLFHLDRAGCSVQVDFDTGATAAAPIGVTLAPGGDEFLAQYDVIRVIDESNTFLSLYASVIPSKTIQCHWGQAVFCPPISSGNYVPIEPVAYPYAATDAHTLTGALCEHGRGIILLTSANVAALQQICTDHGVSEVCIQF